MLAQSFMTAADLGLTEAQHSALIKTLALMDGGKLVHKPMREIVYAERRDQFSGLFNMDSWAWGSECGTVCCIGGTAEIIGGVSFLTCTKPRELTALFYPNDNADDDSADNDYDYDKITVPQAAMALRSYLTTGDARWDLALSDQAHSAPCDRQQVGGE